MSRSVHQESIARQMCVAATAKPPFPLVASAKNYRRCVEPVSPALGASMKLDHPDSNAHEAAVDESSPEIQEFSSLVRSVLNKHFGKRGLAAVAPAAATFSLLSGAEAKANNVVPGTFNIDQVRLINRVCGYFDLCEYNDLLATTPAQYVDAQINASPTVDPGFDATIAPVLANTADPSTAAFRDVLDLNKTPTDLKNKYSLEPNVPQGAFQTLTVARQMTTSHPLRERMVEFWSDHFNVDIRAKSTVFMKPLSDRTVHRAYTLGRFRDILNASTRDAGMMVYLDNWLSRFQTSQPNQGYNENYARELLELHTLGVGNYTETDIRNVARFLAGLTIGTIDLFNGGTFNQSTSLDFVYRASSHEAGGAGGMIGVPDSMAIQVGQSDTSGGQEGENQIADLLDGIQAHPATASFIGGKLMRWFLTYEPDSPTWAAVRSSVEGQWVESIGGLDEVVRTVLDFSHISMIGSALSDLKLKRPSQIFSGLARQFDFTVDGIDNNAGGLNDLVFDLQTMGHAPHQWPAPDGYPDNLDAWVGGLFGRWRFISKMMNNGYERQPGMGGAGTGLRLPDADLLNFFAGVQGTQIGQHLNDVLTGGQMSTVEVSELDGFVQTALSLGPTPAQQYTILREVCALAACTPTYQYY